MNSVILGIFLFLYFCNLRNLVVFHIFIRISVVWYFSIVQQLYFKFINNTLRKDPEVSMLHDDVIIINSRVQKCTSNV